MSIEAANALLKVLEEPSGEVVLILTADMETPATSSFPLSGRQVPRPAGSCGEEISAPPRSGSR